MSESSNEEGSSDEEIDLSNLWRPNPFVNRHHQNDLQENLREEVVLPPNLIPAFSSISSSRSVESLRVQALRRCVANQRPFAPMGGSFASTSARDTSLFGGEIYRPRRLLEHRRSIMESTTYQPITVSVLSPNLEDLGQPETIQLPGFSNAYRARVEPFSSNRRAEFLRSTASHARSTTSWRSEQRENIFNDFNNTFPNISREPVVDSRFLLPTIFEEDENSAPVRNISQERRVELVTNLLMRSLNRNNYAGEQINSPLRSEFRRVNRFLNNSNTFNSLNRVAFHPPYNGRRSVIGSPRDNPVPNSDPDTTTEPAGATSSTPGTNIHDITRSTSTYCQRRIPRLSRYQCETISYPSTISLNPSTSNANELHTSVNDQIIQLRQETTHQEQQQRENNIGVIAETSNEALSISSEILFSQEQNENVQNPVTENFNVSRVQENSQPSTSQGNDNSASPTTYLETVRVSTSSSSTEDDAM